MSTFFPCDDPDFVLPSIENPALFRQHKHRHHRPQCASHRRQNRRSHQQQHQQHHHVKQQRVHNAPALGCNRAGHQNALASEPRNICRGSASFFDSDLDCENTRENLLDDAHNTNSNNNNNSNNRRRGYYNTRAVTDFSDAESDCSRSSSRNCDCDFSCSSASSVTSSDDDDDDEIPARVRPPLRTETSKSGNRLRTIPYASAAVPQNPHSHSHPHQHLDHLRRRQLQSLYARSLDNHCLPLQLAPLHSTTEKCCPLPTNIPTPPISLHSADSIMHRVLRSVDDAEHSPTSPAKKRTRSGDKADAAAKRSRHLSHTADEGTPRRRRGRPPKAKSAEGPTAQPESVAEDVETLQSVVPRDLPSARSKASRSSLAADAFDRDTSMNLSQTTGLDHGTPPRQARAPPKTLAAVPPPDYVYPPESQAVIPPGALPTSPAQSSLFLENSIQIYGMNIPEIMTLGELAGMENMNHAREPFQLPYDRNSWPLWRYLAYLRRKFETMPTIEDIDMLERFFRENGEALQKAYSGVDENIDLLLSLREEGDCYDVIPEAIANDLALVVIPFGIMLLHTLFAASRMDGADSDAGVFRFTQLTIYPVVRTVKWLQTLEQAVTDFRTRDDSRVLQARQRARARAGMVESEEDDDDDDDDGFEPVKGFDPKRDQPRPVQSVLGHGLHIMSDKVNSLYKKLMPES